MKDPRRIKNDPDRAYRAVLLRADEAAQLARDVDNQYADLCQHLRVFHNEGQTTAGGFWRSCTICMTSDETPPSPLSVRETAIAAQEERTSRNNLISVCLLAGAILGALAMRVTIALGWWS